MEPSPKYYAVLTGDLVKSSRLSAQQSREAMDRLAAAVSDFTAVFPDAVHGEIDTFRHDSWQLLLNRPELCLRAATFLRCSLKSLSTAGLHYDSRVSIGLGEVEEISPRISDSRGAAFVSSGKGLDGMEGGATLAFSSPLQWFRGQNALPRAVVPLLDALVLEWSPGESRAVAGSLLGFTQERIAHQWPPKADGRPISRQAVTKTLKRARWRLAEEALQWVEEEIDRALRSEEARGDIDSEGGVEGQGGF